MSIHQRFSGRRPLMIAAVGLVLGVSLGAAGCRSEGPRIQRVTAAEASSFYERGEFARAFTRGRAVARFGRAEEQALGAYIAGLSARRMGDTANAIEFLRRASLAEEDRLAADAAATLGILYSELGRYADAAHVLLEAAERYRGEDRARAYFHAAIAQQKLGRWPQARTNLILARAASASPAFWQRIEEQLSVTGYTIQTGAFRDTDNAQRAADDLAASAARLGIPGPRLVESTDTRGGRVTLVQIGEFATFASARSFSRRLEAGDAVIVPLAGP